MLILSLKLQQAYADLFFLLLYNDQKHNVVFSIGKKELLKTYYVVPDHPTYEDFSIAGLKLSALSEATNKRLSNIICSIVDSAQLFLPAVERKKIRTSDGFVYLNHIWNCGTLISGVYPFVYSSFQALFVGEAKVCSPHLLVASSIVTNMSDAVVVASAINKVNLAGDFSLDDREYEEMT